MLNVPRFYKSPLKLWPLLDGLARGLNQSFPLILSIRTRGSFNFTRPLFSFLDWLMSVYSKKTRTFPSWNLKTGLLASQATTRRDCGQETESFLGFYFMSWSSWKWSWLLASHLLCMSASHFSRCTVVISALHAGQSIFLCQLVFSGNAVSLKKERKEK